MARGTPALGRFAALEPGARALLRRRGPAVQPVHDCRAEIVGRDGKIVARTHDLPRRAVPEAVAWAATELVARGARAFVDGECRPLAHFLEFVPVGQETA